MNIQLNNKVTLHTEDKDYSYQKGVAVTLSIENLKKFAEAVNSLQKEPAAKITRTREFTLNA